MSRFEGEGYSKNGKKLNQSNAFSRATLTPLARRALPTLPQDQAVVRRRVTPSHRASGRDQLPAAIALQSAGASGSGRTRATLSLRASSVRFWCLKNDFRFVFSSAQHPPSLIKSIVIGGPGLVDFFSWSTMIGSIDNG